MEQVEDGRLSRVVKRATQRLIGKLSAFSPAERRGRRAFAEEDRRFDEEYGVQTGGQVALRRRDAPAELRRSAVCYIGSRPSELRAALQKLQIDHRRFSFVDLGSGKGRVLIAACQLPFRKIIGVELSPMLHAIAERNIREFNDPRQRCHDLRVHCGDAGAFELPMHPLVLYMYHPFGPHVMRRVAARLRASVDAEPREVHILYVNPFHLDVWEQAGFHCVEHDGAVAVIRPT